MSKIAIFGRIDMVRERCNACETDAFVVGGRIQCCDAVVAKSGVTSIKREADAVNRRISSDMKARLLRIQEFRCYLCGTDLREELYYRRGKSFKRVTVHFIPKAYCANTDTENIYAMCNLCNQTKGAKLFDSRQEAIEYVRKQRERKGRWELYGPAEIKAVLPMRSNIQDCEPS